MARGTEDDVKLRLIVITGPCRSGKTALAREFEETGHKTRNIGDLLAEQLEREGPLPSSREGLGSAYLELFGLERYLRTVAEAADPGVVLDGLRLPVALPSLWDRCPDLIHIARRTSEARRRTGADADEAFGSEIAELEAMARYVVAWRPSVSQLADVAKEILCDAS
jgi:hypothetical protein